MEFPNLFDAPWILDRTLPGWGVPRAKGSRRGPREEQPEQALLSTLGTRNIAGSGVVVVPLARCQPSGVVPTILW